MKTILEILATTKTPACTRIENPPYLRLVVELLGMEGPTGLPAVSMGHYGEQNGDRMADPEICAELVVEGGVTRLWPYSFRNDYVGFSQVARWQLADGTADERARTTKEIEDFMDAWNENIRDQGFLTVFAGMTG